MRLRVGIAAVSLFFAHFAQAADRVSAGEQFRRKTEQEITYSIVRELEARYPGRQFAVDYSLLSVSVAALRQAREAYQTHQLQDAEESKYLEDIRKRLSSQNKGNAVVALEASAAGVLMSGGLEGVLPLIEKRALRKAWNLVESGRFKGTPIAERLKTNRRLYEIMAKDQGGKTLTNFTTNGIHLIHKRTGLPVVVEPMARQELGWRTSARYFADKIAEDVAAVLTEKKPALMIDYAVEERGPFRATLSLTALGPSNADSMFLYRIETSRAGVLTARSYERLVDVLNRVSIGFYDGTYLATSVKRFAGRVFESIPSGDPAMLPIETQNFRSISNLAPNQGVGRILSEEIRPIEAQKPGTLLIDFRERRTVVNALVSDARYLKHPISFPPGEQSETLLRKLLGSTKTGAALRVGTAGVLSFFAAWGIGELLDDENTPWLEETPLFYQPFTVDGSNIDPEYLSPLIDQAFAKADAILSGDACIEACTVSIQSEVLDRVLEAAAALHPMR